MTTGVRTRVVKIQHNQQATPQQRGDHRADPEVLEKPIRRRFTAEYKLRILREADACSQPGDIGKLLRREGLYSSNLTTWRRQRERGALNGLKANKRGRKASKRNPLLPEVERLRKENQRLAKQLKQANLIIEVQKKVSQLLGIPLQPQDKSEDD
jgi:transposase